MREQARLASKRDPDLGDETRDIKQKFPFGISTDHLRPISSRYRISMKTKQDFASINKYSKDSTPDAILAKAAAKNPYKLNIDVRTKTKGRFG